MDLPIFSSSVRGTATILLCSDLLCSDLLCSSLRCSSLIAPDRADGGHLPNLAQQMSPNREPGHRSTSQDVKHIERGKKECAHARHSTPALVLSKWTISAGKLVP